MNDKDLNKARKPLKKILHYKPTAPKKPSKQPGKDELEQVFKYDGQKIIEVK